MLKEFFAEVRVAPEFLYGAVADGEGKASAHRGICTELEESIRQQMAARGLGDRPFHWGLLSVTRDNRPGIPDEQQLLVYRQTAFVE